MRFKVTFKFWPVQHPRSHATRPTKIFVEAENSAQAIALAKKKHPQSYFMDFTAVKAQWKPEDKETAIVACDSCHEKGLEPTRRNLEQEYLLLK